MAVKTPGPLITPGKKRFGVEILAQTNPYTGKPFTVKGRYTPAGQAARDLQAATIRNMRLQLQKARANRQERRVKHEAKLLRANLAGLKEAFIGGISPQAKGNISPAKHAQQLATLGKVHARNKKTGRTKRGFVTMGGKSKP